GPQELDGDARGSANYASEEGERAQELADIFPESGGVTANLRLSFASVFGFDGEGSPNALNSFSGVVDFDMNTRDIAGPLPSGGVPLGDWFYVNSFMTTFEPIGAVPLTFSFGTNVETSFTPYVVATD